MGDTIVNNQIAGTRITIWAITYYLKITGVLSTLRRFCLSRWNRSGRRCSTSRNTRKK